MSIEGLPAAAGAALMVGSAAGATFSDSFDFAKEDERAFSAMMGGPASSSDVAVTSSANSTWIASDFTGRALASGTRAMWG